jgi:hypothetical protein
MQVLKVGQTIATIDVQLREEGSGMLVAQVREQGKKERKKRYALGLSLRKPAWC